MTADEVRRLLDYDPVTGVFTWRVNPGGKARIGKVAGTTDVYGYTIIRYRGKGYKAHRLAWIHHFGSEPAGLIDHINHDRSDNSIANLRDVDAHINANHIRPGIAGRSGVRGVSWFSQYARWKAMFQYKHKIHFVGHFDTVADAAAALEAARERVRNQA